MILKCIYEPNASDKDKIPVENDFFIIDNITWAEKKDNNLLYTMLMSGELDKQGISLNAFKGVYLLNDKGQTIERLK